MINTGMANVTLIGNLVAEPELTMAGDSQKAKIRIAVNKTWTKDGEKQEYVSYFTVTAWNKLAQACTDYLIKGQQIVVTGELRQERFEDKDTGDPVSYIHVVADKIIFGDKPKSATEGNGSSESEEAPF